MKPEVFDILFAPVQLGLRQDARPCLLLYEPNLEIGWVLCISTQGELCFDRNLRFPLDPSHPDFKRTGLTRRSYIIGEREQKIKISGIIRRLGRLEGNLARDFRDWYGL